jgi:hypothetical protein
MNAGVHFAAASPASRAAAPGSARGSPIPGADQLDDQTLSYAELPTTADRYGQRLTDP